MKTIKFWGASDDLVEVEGDAPGCDEYGAYQSGDDLWAASFQVWSMGKSLKVHALYNGCWSFAVCQSDEDEALPEWPMRLGLNMIRGGIGYSTQLEVDCPDDVSVVRIDRHGKEIKEGDDE